ncbi:MAG: hypothetical protein FWK04_17900 [Nostoc sp. GBBB01]|jgi:hypothetical protein|uniref:Uncharacterized protein n=1 Tax=Nostoc punctiforme FACHB-252 TaxID=1357509 RepID=A0ABR8HJK3_NOSPU|nr:hypothetical protein [Nostoc punctiforme]MBD2615342.1 hypothetical protein [Nostoc punctiforme FACHB-252]MBL1200905.1 hypothetical protein [Nostoc sp. GBBB01]
MITNFCYVEELSPSQTETISGGFPAKIGNANYDFNLTDTASPEDDWTVTFVRGKGRGRGRDVFTYSARYV